MSLGKDQVVVVRVVRIGEVVAQMLVQQDGHEIGRRHRRRGVPGAGRGGAADAVYAQLLRELVPIVLCRHFSLLTSNATGPVRAVSLRRRLPRAPLRCLRTNPAAARVPRSLAGRWRASSWRRRWWRRGRGPPAVSRYPRATRTRPAAPAQPAPP